MTLIEHPAAKAKNGKKPLTLDQIRSATDLLEAEGELHGDNLRAGTYLVTDFAFASQDIGGGTTVAGTGVIFDQAARTADKVLMWLMQPTDEAVAEYDPRNPRKGAELVHTFSSVIRRQLTKIGRENLPVLATFVRRETADGRIDPRTGEPFSAWAIDA